MVYFKQRNCNESKVKKWTSVKMSLVKQTATAVAFGPGGDDYQSVTLIAGVCMVLETAAPLLPPAVITWSCSW